ncbi:MAG: DUF5320 domain-containing protein [Methanocellales archaeon]|nr:DUF5320 domain-containing protein [Methanocellales archaeon]
MPRGFGRGNPYPFCRRFPWLPRWWWTGMYGPITPYEYDIPASMLPAPIAPWFTKEQEIQMLESQAKVIEQQLEEIRKRLKEHQK